MFSQRQYGNGCYIRLDTRLAFLRKNDVQYYLSCIHLTSIALCASLLLLSINANPTEIADSNAAVRNTRLYDPGDGYDPSTPSTVW